MIRTTLRHSVIGMTAASAFALVGFSGVASAHSNHPGMGAGSANQPANTFQQSNHGSDNWTGLDPAQSQRSGQGFNQWWGNLMSSPDQNQTQNNWGADTSNPNWQPDSGSTWQDDWSNWNPQLWREHGSSFSNWRNQFLTYLRSHYRDWMNSSQGQSDNDGNNSGIDNDRSQGGRFGRTGQDPDASRNTNNGTGIRDTARNQSRPANASLDSLSGCPFGASSGAPNASAAY